MSDEKQKPPPTRPSAPAGPPRLERVPEGYRPPPGVRPPAAEAPSPRPSVAAPPAAAPPRSGPAAPAAGPPPARAAAAPASSYGLAARHVGADAAIAAGLAHQGSLATESAIYLFALAAAVQATGRLTLTPEGRSFALTFRRGTVEHAASSDPHDDLGSFLVRKGALKPETLLRAEAGKAARGGDLASTLIAERLVNPADVASFLQEHGTQLVQRALVSEGGGWSWSPDAAPPPDAFPLGAPLAMLCAAVRTLDAATLMRRLGDREQRVPSRIGGRIRIEDLRLTPQETRAAGLFDGSRTTREIAVASPTEALLVLRLAFLLGELELLAFGPARRSDPVPAPPAPPPGPAPTVAKIAATPPLRAPAPAPAGPTPTANPATIPNPAPSAKPAAPAAPPRPPVPSRPAAPVPASKPAGTPAPAAAPPKPALDRASLEALQTKLSGADHFAILGVKQDAAGGQIKAAYFQLAKAYHPDAIPADAAPEVKKLCADVFAKVSEAWSVLGEDALRAAYLEKLRSGGTAEVDVMNIFQAENLFQEGTLLVKGRKYDDAVRKFDEAMKLNPDEAEFGMWKAWCEFLLSDDRKKKVAPASSAIEVGLKKNPRCAQGYLFLGQMAKLAGDLTLAEKHLRRGLAVTPDHADLQRELKYLRK